MASTKSIFLILSLAALSNALSIPYQIKTLSNGKLDQQRAFAKEIFQGNTPFGLTTRQPMLQNPNSFNQQQMAQPTQQFNQFGNQRSFENQHVNPTQFNSIGNQQAFIPSQASVQFQQNPNKQQFVSTSVTQQQNEFQPIQNSQQTTAFTPNQNMFFDSNQQFVPVVSPINQQRFVGQAQANLMPISEQTQLQLPKAFNQQQMAQPTQQFNQFGNQRSFENQQFVNQQAFMPSQASVQFQQNPNKQQFVSTSVTQQQNEFQPIQNSQQFVFTTQPAVIQQTTVDSNQQFVPVVSSINQQLPKTNQRLLNNQNNEVFQLIQTLNPEQISEKLQKMQSNVQQANFKPTFTTTKVETTTVSVDSQNQFNSHSQMHFITNNPQTFNNQQQEQEASLTNNNQQVSFNNNNQQKFQRVQFSNNNQQEALNTLDINNQQKTQQDFFNNNQQFQQFGNQQQEVLFPNNNQQLAQKIPFNSNFENQEALNEFINNNQQTLRNKNMEQTTQVSEVQETTTPQSNSNSNRQNFNGQRIQTPNLNRFEPFVENQTPRPINVLSTTTRRTVTKMVFPSTTVATTTTRSTNRAVNRISDQQNTPIKLSFNGQAQRPTQPDNKKLQQSFPNQIRNTLEEKSSQRVDQLEQQPLQQETFCFGRQPEDRVPYPFDQNKFVVCHSETHFDVMTCPQRLVFNLNTLNCESSFKAPSTCASNPCQNGGKCIEMPFFQFSCECPFGFGGERCEKFDVCKPDTCGQNGVCVSLSPGSPVGHYCICANGLSYGLDCGRNTEPNPCLSNDSHDVNFPSKTNPSIFTHCEGHIPHVKFCSFPLVFSFEKQHCDWKDV